MKARLVIAFYGIVFLVMPMVFVDSMIPEGTRMMSIDGIFFGVMLAVYPIGGYFLTFVATRNTIPQDVS